MRIGNAAFATHRDVALEAVAARLERLERFSPTLTHPPLMPAKAGIQFLAKELGPRFPPSLKLRRTAAEPVEALAKTGRGDERKKRELIRLMRKAL
jgi:hypothetical protein